MLRRKQLLVRFSLTSVCGLEEITETLFFICCQWLAAVALSGLGDIRLVTFDNHNDEIQLDRLREGIQNKISVFSVKLLA